MSAIKFNFTPVHSMTSLFSPTPNSLHIPTAPIPLHLDLSPHLTAAPSLSVRPLNSLLQLPSDPHATSALTQGTPQHIAILNSTPSSTRPAPAKFTEIGSAGKSYENAVWTAEILPAQAEKIADRIAQNGISGGAKDFASYILTIAAGPVLGSLGAALKTSKFSSYLSNITSRTPVRANPPPSTTEVRTYLKGTQNQISAIHHEIQLLEGQLGAVQTSISKLLNTLPKSSESAAHFTKLKDLRNQERKITQKIKNHQENLGMHETSIEVLRGELIKRSTQKIVDLH